MSEQFRCYFITKGYFLDAAFQTLKEAVQEGQAAGVEFVIYLGDITIGACRGPYLQLHLTNSRYSDKARATARATARTQ